jgi:hypothetical protein
VTSLFGIVCHDSLGCIREEGGLFYVYPEQVYV